ncbi:hypothetical protein JTB14_011469 [Gonioctena quinquepunctata]|nr:hypothetical protein JTB14_011469 [Gonioctena quinquepunctata]
MVEEHRLARNVSENILLDSGMDLFADKAYQFYKDCRTRVGTVISSYFNRLQCPISEDAKLAIVMKNLHPFCQDRFRDPLPSNLLELRNVCRRMESRRDNSYVEPSSRKGNIIEKDLAFMEVTEELNALEVRQLNTRRVDHNRCHNPGHRAIATEMFWL